MKFEIYRDKKKEFRWRLYSKGRIIGDSGEGYKRKSKCRRTIEHMVLHIGTATIIEA